MQPDVPHIPTGVRSHWCFKMTGGLEVEDVSSPGTFVSATRITNAIVMNVGDLLQMWSNGSSLDILLVCSQS